MFNRLHQEFLYVVGRLLNTGSLAIFISLEFTGAQEFWENRFRQKREQVYGRECIYFYFGSEPFPFG